MEHAASLTWVYVQVVVATGAQLGDCVGLTVADVGIAAPVRD
jgi:hypothetical protein